MGGVGFIFMLLAWVCVAAVVKREKNQKPAAGFNEDLFKLGNQRPDPYIHEPACRVWAIYETPERLYEKYLNVVGEEPPVISVMEKIWGQVDWKAPHGSEGYKFKYISHCCICGILEHRGVVPRHLEQKRCTLCEDNELLCRWKCNRVLPLDRDEEWRNKYYPALKRAGYEPVDYEKYFPPDEKRKE